MQPQEGRCRPHLRGYADRRGEHGEESVAYARHRRRLLPDWGAHSRIVSQAFCGEVCCDPVPWQTRTLGQVVRVGEIDQEAGRQTQGLAGNRKSDGRAARGGDGAAAAEGRTHMAQDSAWLPGTGGREARASRGLCGTIHLRACSSRIGSAGFGGVGERRRGEGAHCLRLLRHARAPEPGAAAALGRCPRGRPLARPVVLAPVSARAIASESAGDHPEVALGGVRAAGGGAAASVRALLRLALRPEQRP
mmetsp:Transcript_85546/g.276031  ORF Transcript_85546/g.276031 Transcript_85546/m.276031 type:complete len:249 (+) Transcript_85546:388-1134(+)